AGGLQAPQGAGGRRAGQPEPGRAAPAVPPRGGGVRPDDQVDRAVPPAGRGALPAPRRRAGAHGRQREQHRGEGSGIMSATVRNETEIIVPEGLPIIEIIREFEAPVDRLFRAYADPGLFVQWVGPRSIDSRVDVWDCSTGG